MKYKVGYIALLLVVCVGSCKKATEKATSKENPKIQALSEEEPPPLDDNDLIVLSVLNASSIPISGTTVNIVGNNNAYTGITNTSGWFAVAIIPGNYDYQVIINGNVIATGSFVKQSNIVQITVQL